MSKITHELEQGSAAWHAFRAEHFGASEAAAMLGLSKHQTRAELLRRKATGIEPEVSPQLQAVFDRGHATEIGGRALAERIIGQELFPVTMSEGKLSASCDGLTMLEDIAFEHKQYNAALADSVRAGVLPEEHQPQCQQVMMVTGADKLLFMVSDGTEDNHAWMWVYPDEEWRKTLLQGWTQFAIDLEAYIHVEAKPEPVAATIEALPALVVQVEGRVLSTNLAAFKARAQTFIDSIKTELVTDQDFADADKMVKFLKDGVEKLELAKQQALAQTASIDELFRTVDAIGAQMRDKRLALEKLVKAEKEIRKTEIVRTAQMELASYITKLNDRIGGNWMPGTLCTAARFAEAVKGLKTLDSMRDKVATALSQAKIEANEVADRIQANRLALLDAGRGLVLFPDFAHVCTKATDDFAALLALRIQQDDQRLEAEREAAVRQEQARAEAQRAQQAAHEAQAQAADATEAPAAVAAPVTARAAMSARHDTNDAATIDDAMIDDFIRLLPISAVEKKALRANLVKWEKYRIARQMQEAA